MQEADGASRFIREGTQFSMPLHGFIKDVAWSGSAAVDATGARIQCSVESSSLPPAFKAMFPFAFKVCVVRGGEQRSCVWPMLSSVVALFLQISAEYSIQDGGLQFVAKVTATGEKVLPFSIGNHIALKYPFLDVDGRYNSVAPASVFGMLGVLTVLRWLAWWQRIQRRPAQGVCDEATGAVETVCARWQLN